METGTEVLQPERQGQPQGDPELKPADDETLRNLRNQLILLHNSHQVLYNGIGTSTAEMETGDGRIISIILEGDDVQLILDKFYLNENGSIKTSRWFYMKGRNPNARDCSWEFSEQDHHKRFTKSPKKIIKAGDHMAQKAAENYRQALSELEEEKLANEEAELPGEGLARNFLKLFGIKPAKTGKD